MNEDHTGKGNDGDKLLHCSFCGKKSNRIVDNESPGSRGLTICCESCDSANDISRRRTREEYELQA